MLLHSDDGTHKLELPVSMTTLKVCGGVPTVTSLKSILSVNLLAQVKSKAYECYSRKESLHCAFM